MAEPPLVSIIIPCYNPGPMLEVCLSSCFGQTHPAIEIVLVDNNSTDGSAKLARKLASGKAQKLVVTRCREQGQCASRNHGVRLARGRYIQWLDADDELSPDKIARQVAALDAAPDRDVAYCDWDWRFFEDHEMREQLSFPARQHDDFLLTLLADNWSPPHAYLVRREAAERIQEAGGWRPEAQPADDRHYFTLAAVLGCRFLYVSGCRALYNNWSEGQVTKTVHDAERARSLENMFADLRAQAERQPPSRLTAEHRRLLDQDRGLWRPARLRRLPGKGPGVRVRNLETGAEARLEALEARAHAVLVRWPYAATLEDYGFIATLGLWLAVVGRMSRGGANPAPKEMLRRFRELLALPPGLDEGEEARMAFLPLRPVPYKAPIFLAERLVVHRAVTGLAEKGALTRLGETE